MKKLPDVNEKDRHIAPVVDKPEDITEPTDDNSDSEDIGDNVQEMDDGSAIVTLDDEKAPTTTGFLDNLAEVFDERDLTDFANKYCELLTKDREARSRRDKQYEEGLRRTGLGDDAPGGAGFSGASKVVHPILAEACVDFASRAMKELFPPSGPVKSQIIGKETEDKIALANRKVKFLNWQTTKKIQEYRTEQEQLLTQLPMGGSQYQKFWYSPKLKRPQTEFVPIDDILVPYAATYFYTANRITHVQHITDMEYQERVDSGLYRDLGVLSAVPTNDLTAAARANERIEGKEADAYNDDGLRDIYEIYTWVRFKDDDIANDEVAPYIITVDAYTEKVLSIYRNWREGDESFEKLDWLVEWKFIPWRGAYGVGLPHLIGGISAALTGALRALLDSAHINNSQTLVKLKGGRVSGQNLLVEQTQISEIEGPAGADDIRKVLMPMPYNAPSQVLFQLLDWLTNAGKGVVASSAESLNNVGDRTPVGTTMAMVEQNSMTYSSIHSRLHFSQAKALEILCRINSDFLDDQEIIEELDELIISREDFKKTNDILPVSDPNIFSETQRYAQIQGIAQVKQMFPTLPFNDNAIARRMLLRMRIENIDEILPEPKKAQNLNPVAENIAAMHATPLLAMPKQNHLAHLFCHLDYATSPIFGAPPMAIRALPILIEHVTQHIGFYYADEMAKSTNFEQLAESTPTSQMEDSLAHAHSVVMAKIQQTLMPFMQKLQQVQQAAAAMAPKPPPDPAIEATMQAAMAEIDRKTKRDNAELALKREEILNIKPEIERMKYDVTMLKNEQDNAQKQQTELLKNQGDNQTLQFIAAMKLHMENYIQQFQSKLDALQGQSELYHQKDLANLDQQTQVMLGHQQGQQQMQQQEAQQAAEPPQQAAPAQPEGGTP